MDIKRIVNCTPEQFEALHRDGQVEVDGVIRTREEGTLYNPGELPLLEWYNKIMYEVHKQYEITHTPITIKTLEQEYDDILASDERYVGVSAVGYRAILQNGDTVKVAGNGGDFFLNGERLTKDYTYDGEGCEMVSVWVFEGVGGVIVLPPTLDDTPTFSPYEVNIKSIGQTPTINEAYYLYASKITTYNFKLSTQAKGCKTIISNGAATFSQTIPTNILEIYSNCEYLTSGLGKSVKKVVMPELKEINIDGDNLRDNIITDWQFGKLIKISGPTSSYTAALFHSAHTVYIPNTVKTIIGRVAGYNTNVILNCNKANSIDNNWCTSGVTNFTMAKDWNCSVNIAVVARNWTKDRFVDLFANYLVDLSYKEGDTLIEAERELTIPQAIYDILTDEEFAIAENKGWIIGGA